jgi:hypothetical protein
MPESASPRRQRVFLGWDQPFLLSAAEKLFEQQKPSAERVLDLRDLVVVTSVARAGRRFLEILAEKSQAASLILIPPHVIGVGALPEMLIKRAGFSLASDSEAQLAWVSGLRSIDPAIRQRAFPGLRDDSLLELSTRAKLLQQISRELAAADLDFEALAKQVSEWPVSLDELRYEALAAIEIDYRSALIRMQRADQYEERRKHVQHSRSGQAEFHHCAQLLLLGVADMPQLTAEILRYSPVDISAYIFAPEDSQAGFDDLGCLVHSFWESFPTEIQDEDIRVAEGFFDEAALAVEEIGKYIAQKTTAVPEDFAFCVSDSARAPFLEEAALERSIHMRSSSGRPLVKTGPCRLLALLAEYLSKKTFSALKNLLLAEDILVFLPTLAQTTTIKSEELAIAIDRYEQKHLPFRVAGALLQCRGETPQITVINVLIEFVQELFSEKRLIPDWCRTVRDFLLRVYGVRRCSRESPEERILIEVSKILGAELDQWEYESSEDTHPLHGVSSTASEFLQLFHQALQSKNIPEEFDSEAIELMGWLELALDDAPCATVLGCNEGFFPEAVTSDIFLPDALRQKLALMNNVHRFARDNFLLATVLATKKKITFFCSRRNPRGDRLLPGRLLYSRDKQRLAEQAENLLLGIGQRVMLSGSVAAQTDAGIAEPPRPRTEISTIETLGVTAFRDYLECPYRFYVKHIEKVRERHFGLHELDGRDFGTLLHAVLEEFAKSAVRDSDHAKIIDEACQSILEQECSLRFDLRKAEPALRLQFEQLRLRLKAFSKVQADRRQSGWSIFQTEFNIESSLFRLDTSFGSVGISGRIDRIDLHEESGSLAILDYKSADKALDPDKSHRSKKGKWKDLQLPLYHFAVAEKLQKPIVELGYFLLPPQEDEVGLARVNWQSEDLEDARQVARQVAEKILRAEFWPPAILPESRDAYASICRTGSFSWEEV